VASVNMDTSEWGALAADLTAAGSGVAAVVRPIVHKGASNIKNQLRAEMRSSRHFRPVARAIDYSMHGGMSFGVGMIEAEIGPRRGSPGSLANVAIFGTSRGGGNVPDPRRALEAEAPNVERALLDAIGHLL
jgi:hypothetical protein